jgi:hypothetical protein
MLLMQQQEYRWHMLACVTEQPCRCGVSESDSLQTSACRGCCCCNSYLTGSCRARIKCVLHDQPH